MIQNLIFDLGNVLLKIDFDKSAKAFEALGVKDFDKFFSANYVNPLFQELEKGEKSEVDFCHEIKLFCSPGTSNEQIIEAWNALVLEYFENRIEVVQKMKADGYRVFLLSNTNEVHVRYFEKIFVDKFKMALHDLFDCVYYSHEMGDRKPNESCFIKVIDEQALDARSTLFIDDNEMNTLYAKKTGIHSLWLHRNSEHLINHYDSFKNFLTSFNS